MKCLLPALLICLAFQACKSSQPTPPMQGPATASEAKEMKDREIMQRSGTDLFGEGSIPTAWKLQVNYDDTVRFTADDGLSLKCAFNQLKKEINGGQSMFSGRISGGDLAITIVEKACALSSKKEVYKKQVTVNFNSRIYTGCANFLADNTLNNKWLLEKIGNTPINPADYNRVPVFEFDLTKGQVTGNDGCNSMSGKMEVQGKRIKFYPIARTEMACEKKDIGIILSQQISDKLVNYYFKEGKLYLYLPDDSLLVFKKI